MFLSMVLDGTALKKANGRTGTAIEIENKCFSKKQNHSYPSWSQSVGSPMAGTKHVLLTVLSLAPSAGYGML